MKTSFLINDRIYLRAIEPEDLDVLYAMENDPETWDISNFSVPYSKYALKQYIENSQSDMFADRQLRLMIIRKDDQVVLGTIDLFDFAPFHARAEVGIAVLKEHQGSGYAKDALQLLCDYAFCFLHMKQLYAHVAVDNAASVRLFSTCGFVECGRLKEWWRVKGSFKDVLLMQHILNE